MRGGGWEHEAVDRLGEEEEDMDRVWQVLDKWLLAASSPIVPHCIGPMQLKTVKTLHRALPVDTSLPGSSCPSDPSPVSWVRKAKRRVTRGGACSWRGVVVPRRRLII